MRRIIALFVLLLGGPAALAADVALIGVFGEKAVVIAIDGGNPKTVRVGQTWNGIKVLEVKGDLATLEIEGKRQVLRRGMHYRAAAAVSDQQSVTLSADSQGHFVYSGSINGSPVRFVIDTGATLVALPGAEARRLGLDYRKGQRGITETAGGPVEAYRVRLDRVRLGDIELLGVDGVVIEQGLNIALLGMSFLNRVEMKREGQTMTLIRRF